MTFEIRCAQLTEEQLRGEIEFFAQLFIDSGKCSVIAMYGWDCDLTIDDMYQDIEIGSSEVAEFARRSEIKGIFRLGRSDLLFRSSDGEIQFALCHESDVHFSGPAPLMSDVRERWDQLDFGPYTVERSEEDSK
jgi:hypothetical protein